MGIYYQTKLVTVAGTAGSATGSATFDRPVMGEVLAIHFDFTAQPGTCDTTIATAGKSYPARDILVLTNVNTDGWYQPRAQSVSTAGASVTDYDCIAVSDYVTASVSQGDAGSVSVTIIYEG
jgi:hypothetical protein